MNIDSLKQARNVLLRTAVVSVVLIYLLAALTLGFWDTWAAMTSQLMRTPTAAFGPVISNFFGFAKFYVLFLLLAPALGLHWEIKSREKPSAASHGKSIDHAATARGV